MLAWIGHRDKQYHLIYSSQPGLWSSVLNRGLPSTQCIHMANTVLVEWSNFSVGQSCLFSNCMTWAIWVWSRKNTLCVINVLIMPILIDVKCSQSCYIHFLHTLSTITLFYAVSWNLNFKALNVCCRGEFFWHSWDITGVWESFWRVRWLWYYFFVILLMNVNKTLLNIYNIFKTKK